jgi:hypothetical protein
MGTTSWVDLVTTRFLCFRETSVRVTTSPFLEGMFLRIPTETRGGAFLDLVFFRSCETTIGGGGGRDIRGGPGREESW